MSKALLGSIASKVVTYSPCSGAGFALDLLVVG